MPPPLRRVVQHLRRLAGPPPSDAAGDRQLLAAFAGRRDEAAFAELVRRHGPLVRGVCRRVLGDAHAAEDAFQAAFLLLARKAGAPGWGDSIAGWLHATAWHLARKARTADRRRQAREGRTVHPVADPDPSAAAAWRELCHILDGELNRLPGRLRAPLVLCYLEGRTRDEAARLLGWSLGTLKRRLERGRAILRDRLTRRGVTLAAAGLPAALAESAVSAATAAVTAQAATAFVSGGAVSAAVGALLEGAAPAVGVKATVALGGLLAVVALAVGTARFAAPAGPQGPPAPAKVGIPAAPQVKRDQFNDPLPPGAIARFGTVMLRHGDDIKGVRFTPDGKHVVSWAWDGVRVWDAASGAQVRSFAERPTAAPWQMDCAALSPDGATMAVVYANPREEQIPRFDGREGNTEIWDVATGQMLHWFPTRRFAQPVFTPDGRTLAVLGSDEKAGEDQHAIVLVDAATGQELRRLRGHQGDTRGLVFRLDGKEAITTSEDGTVRVWDVATGREVRQFAKPPVPVGEPVVSPDGRWLATIDRPKKRGEGFVIGGTQPNDRSPIRLWDVATGREVQLFAGHNGGSWHLTFTPDGRRLLSASMDRVIREWDTATGRELRTLPQDWCRGLALSPDGRTLADAGLRPIRLRDPATGADRVPVMAPEWWPNLIALSPDGRTVATAGENERTVYVWEAGTGKLLRRLEGQGRGVRGLVWGTDGKTLLAATVNTDGTEAGLHLWETASGRELPRPPGFDKPFVLFLPSPDGRRIVTVDQLRSAVVWDRATGRAISECVLPPDLFGLTADGAKLLGLKADEKTAVLWDLTAGRPLHTFPVEPKERIKGVALSPDGRWLAVVDWEKTITLYDVATGKEVRRIDGLSHDVGPWLAFSADSRRLAAGDYYQGGVRVWDVTTGQKLHDFVGHRGGVSALTFTPDGRRLMSGSGDTTALVWDVSDLRPADK